MQKSTNPLDNIKIASPCSADWNKMYGDSRRRFCSLCELNVYNLSEMTRDEAENFLINSEGRVCLQVFRRSDGTVLTQNCPVGWQAVKKKVSYIATAAFALLAGLINGIFAVESIKFINSLKLFRETPKSAQNSKAVSFGLYGGISNLPEIKAEILRNRDE